MIWCSLHFTIVRPATSSRKWRKIRLCFQSWNFFGKFPSLLPLFFQMMEPDVWCWRFANVCSRKMIACMSCLQMHCRCSEVKSEHTLTFEVGEAVSPTSRTLLRPHPWSQRLGCLKVYKFQRPALLVLLTTSCFNAVQQRNFAWRWVLNNIEDNDILAWGPRM